MKLDTLYKRTKTGAIQYWKIEALRGFGRPDGSPCAHIIKESGQLGTTSPILHKEDVKVGKNIGRSNETTPLQQAELQAQSDWKSKHDEGYKSLLDLGIYPVDLGQVDNRQQPIYHHRGYNRNNHPNTGLSLADALDQCLPKFNSDANGNVKPMLAKTVDWKKVTYPCYVQPKLDGVRCLMIVNTEGEISPVRFLSRSGKDYVTLGHIASEVITYLANQLQHPIAFTLDGEIYSDELTFQEIVAAVKKISKNSLKLKFRAYDIVNEEDQAERIAQTFKLVMDIDSDHIHFVPTKTIESKEQIKELHDTWVAEGYEGAMVRLPLGHYAQGQRSSHLYKVKEFDEAEFAFKNFEFGQRGVEDLIAVCWLSDGQREFRAKVIGSKVEKEELYSRNDLEGRSFTVKFFGYTDDGLPRFPVGKGFRDY